jgi:dephospho-CoA kinase
MEDGEPKQQSSRIKGGTVRATRQRAEAKGMRIVGLLGGVASGKSYVAGLFCRLGAALLDADGAGHEVLREPEVESAARRRWGGEVFGPDGRIDRSRLAGIVFAAAPDGPRELEYLEQLTHPRIEDLLRRQARQLEAAGRQVAVLDAPVMLKAGWDAFCDILVFVDAPREVRLARARGRGWTEDEFAAREAAQESLEAKRQRADMVIDNSGSPEATQAQLERCWHAIVG